MSQNDSEATSISAIEKKSLQATSTSSKIIFGILEIALGNFDIGRGFDSLKNTYSKATRFVKNLLGMGMKLVSDQNNTYRVGKKIGEGGMGVVYRATDRKGKEVAVKVTHSQQGLRRFRLEVAILKLLGKHPNLPELIDWGLDASETKFCVMEYIAGETLHEIIRRQSSWFYKKLLRNTLEVSSLLLVALNHVHKKKVIHRDIKPHNIIVHQQSNGNLQVKLMDFGVSKPMEKGFLSFLHRTINFDEKALTMPGEPIGTLGYAPREQIDNISPDETADIFSCGVTIYEMMQGGFLFRGSTISKYLYELETFEFAPVVILPEEAEGCLEIASKLNASIEKALSKKPSHRQRRAGKLHKELESLRHEFNKKQKKG